jgi:hypothetical protein
MSVPKKTRPDSVLRNFPADRQREIVEFLDGRPAANGVDALPGKSLRECKQWLAEDGLKVSENSLSEFRSWWLLREQALGNERFAAGLMELKRKEGAPEEEVFAFGQEVFARLAIEQEDNLGFVRILRERSREKAVVTLREKFEFDAAKACLKMLPELKVISSDSKLSETEKINAVRLKLFGEVAE